MRGGLKYNFGFCGILGISGIVELSVVRWGRFKRERSLTSMLRVADRSDTERSGFLHFSLNVMSTTRTSIERC